MDRHDHIGRGTIGLDGFRPFVRDEAFANIPKILETPKALADDGREWDQINLVNPSKQLTALQAYQTTAVSSISQRLGDVSADLNTAFRDALIGMASGQKTADQALQGLQAVQDAAK